MQLCNWADLQANMQLCCHASSNLNRPCASLAVHVNANHHLCCNHTQLVLWQEPVAVHARAGAGTGTIHPSNHSSFPHPHTKD